MIPKIHRMYKLMRYLFFLLSVFAILSCQSVIKKPEAKSGIIDLRGVDISKNGLIELKGEYEFYHKKFFKPSDFKLSQNPDAIVKVPDTWSSYLINDEKVELYGYGTFRLKILVNKSLKSFRLKIDEQTPASRYYINGQLVAWNGELGINRKEMEPQLNIYFKDFNITSDTIELVVNISNYHIDKGGIIYPLYIGETTIIAKSYRNYYFLNIFIIGAFIMMMLYHMNLFLLRKKDIAFLYFSLACLTISIYILHISHIFYILFPNLNFEITYKTLRISLFGTVPVFSIFLYHLFKEDFNKKILYVIESIGISYLGFILFFPSYIYSHITQSYRYYMMASILYGIYVITKATIKGREYSRVFLIAFIIFYTSTLNDTLLYAGYLKTIDLTAYGLFLFIIIQTFILSSRFSRVSHDAERRAIELKNVNENLEKLVKIRTLEILNSRQRYYNLVNLMPETIFETDTKGNFLFLNHTSYKIFGYEEGAPVKTVFEVIAPEEHSIIINNIKRLFVDKSTKGNQYTGIRKNGERFPILIYSRVIEENNIIKGIQGILIDVSERVKSEQKLKESEDKYRKLVEHSNDLIIIHKDGKILFANQKAVKTLGYDSPEGLNLFKEIIAPEYRELTKKYHDDRLSSKEAPSLYEIIVISKNGTRIPLEVNSSIIQFNKEDVVISVARDLTHRKKAEAQLIRLGVAISQIFEGVVITDLSGIIEYTNPAYELLTQYTKEELIGLRMSLMKSGMQDQAFYNEMWNIINRGETWTGIFINKKKNGVLYDEHCVITPLKNEANEIISFIAVKRDITEDRNKEKQYRQSQKLQAIGTLAGGIAHDFNNILMGMQLYTELSIKTIENKEKTSDYLKKLLDSQKRAKALINQILSFSRNSNEEDKEPISIHLVVKEALKLIQSTFPKTVTISEKINDCGHILGNPTNIQQIIMNLCNNANHAIDGNGLITVELKMKEMNERQWVCLSVEDNGCGMDKEIRDRIFEPFFTTKEVGKGTGLGLATVHGIVKQYKGEIFFSSEVNKGSIFYVFLPSLEAKN